MASVNWNAGAAKALLIKAMNAGLTAAAEVAANQAERSFGSDHGGVPSAPGSPPNSQTGHLRNSIAYCSPDALGTPLRAAYGTNVAYGRHLEFGAVIRPKSVKYLPVPINLPARLMLRRLGGFGVGVVGSLRTQNLMMIRPKGKPAMLVEKTPTGRIKKNGAAFVLKKSVKIAARPWAKRAGIDAASQMKAAAQYAAAQVMAGG